MNTYVPNRIDLPLSITGGRLQGCVRARVRGRFRSGYAWFISFGHLIKSRESTERKKDKVDVELLMMLGVETARSEAFADKTTCSRFFTLGTRACVKGFSRTWDAKAESELIW